MKFSFKIEDLELRSCDEHLMCSETHDRAEIVKWESDNHNHCYTIAYWDVDKEGYYAKFVGNRFVDIDSVALLKLLNKGQQILDVLFESE